MAGGATFDSTVIGTSVGLNIATQETQDKLNLVVAKASELLNLATAGAAAVGALGFNDLPDAPGVNFNAQLDQFRIPDKPVIDFDEFTFNDPTAPTLPAIETNPGAVGAERPPTDVRVLTALVEKLLDLINDEGLPEEWHRLNKERILDSLTEAKNLAQDEVTTQFARRGWTMPTGTETGRIDEIGTDYSRRISGAIRDYTIEALKINAEILIKSLELAIAYFRAWVDLYRADIDIDIQIGDQTLRGSALILQRLQAELGIYQARVSGEVARLGAVSSKTDAQTRQYTAEAGVSGAIAQRDQAAAGIEIQRSSLESNHVIQGHGQTLAERRRDIDEALTNVRTEVDAYTRVTQALWQAVNVSTSISSGSTDGFSRSLGADWSYSESKKFDE